MDKDELKKGVQLNYVKEVHSRLKTDEIFIKAFSGSYLSNGYFIKGTEFRGFLIIKKSMENPILIFDSLPDEISIQNNFGMNSLTLSSSIQNKLSTLLAGVIHIYFSPQNEFANINILQTKIDGRFLIEDYTASVIGDIQSFLNSEKNKQDSISKIVIIANPRFLLNKDAAIKIESKNNVSRYGNDSGLRRENRFQNNSSNAFSFDINSTTIKLKLKTDQFTRTRGTQFLAPLPYTAVEADNIRENLSSNNIKVLIKRDEDANEDAIKNEITDYDVIHIATHGYYRGDQDTLKVWKAEYLPYFKVGLCLAGAQNTLNVHKPYNTNLNNGILTGFEIKNLNLTNTKLVVLSSCETGIGDIIQAESSYSLQRAFSIAGAKAVIMTLWKVADKATQLLMGEFYKNWLTKNMSKSKALQQAQLYLKNIPTYNNPRYWGAFVLVGE